MGEGLIVRPLVCGHCGTRLPIMGQFVTFRCSTCFRYWVLTPEGLEPVTVYRVLPPEDFTDEPISLPFWIIEVNTTELRRQIETVRTELCDTAKTIVSTNIDLEKESELDDLIYRNSDLDRRMKKVQFISEASNTKKIPAKAELNYLLRRIEGPGQFYIYVPAFLSNNTYAYLKIGRLFTQGQPSFRAEKSSGTGGAVLCALQADEAESLMDFIFFATLPDSMQRNGDFLKKIHLEPSGPPRLAEFPFEQRGSSLVSLIGGFHISSRLV
ncbi:MAG: hypothetical protein KAX38_09180, partial [Candidatus Krumholzibacteria bacterium]|nr:hypothetical protein [Candidatus Krumholzibacteria bacterium]